jgi:hypothetical protein
MEPAFIAIPDAVQHEALPRSFGTLWESGRPPGDKVACLQRIAARYGDGMTGELAKMGASTKGGAG